MFLGREVRFVDLFVGVLFPSFLLLVLKKGVIVSVVCNKSKGLIEFLSIKPLI